MPGVPFHQRGRVTATDAWFKNVSDTIEFRVGTASWTDPTLSELFYPPSARSAEERLRFYAEQFNTVEVDSTFYALPAERNAKLLSLVGSYAQIPIHARFLQPRR